MSQPTRKKRNSASGSNNLFGLVALGVGAIVAAGVGYFAGKSIAEEEQKQQRQQIPVRAPQNNPNRNNNYRNSNSSNNNNNRNGIIIAQPVNNNSRRDEIPLAQTSEQLISTTGGCGDCSNNSSSYSSNSSHRNPIIDSHANAETKTGSSNNINNTISPDDLQSALDDDSLCKICFENPMDSVLIPCGHIISCVSCASALKECAVCRYEIKQVVKVYKS